MYQHQTHIPHPPSRFNPNPMGFRLDGKRKLSIAQGRGTMSMPTSPLGSSINNEPFPWDSGPQSAQAFFTQQPEYPSQSPFKYQPQEQPHAHAQGQQPTHIAPSYLSSSSDRTSTISPSNDLRPNGSIREYDQEQEYEQDHDPEQGHEHGREDDVPPPRKKRAQVRVACTHCQKACKKCSNTRPCERCVKYGLEDCMDSLRKPRKTGIKRGPYKRRTSSLYQQPDYQSAPNTHTHSHQFSQHSNPPNDNIHTLGGGTISQAFAAAFVGPRWINGRRESITQTQTQSQSQVQVPLPVYGYGAPIQAQTPMPQRQRIPSIIPNVMNMNEGDGRRGSMSTIFPMGLNTMSGQDPFSRTVSPIGHRFRMGGNGLTISMGMGMDVDQDIDVGMGMGMNGDINMDNHRDPQMLNSGDITMAPSLSVVDFAYQNTNPNPHSNHVNTFHSAPTSPRGTRMDLEVNQDRAASAEPPTSSCFDTIPTPAHALAGEANPFLLGHDQDHVQYPDQDSMMGRTRKSSLFTLLHSRPNTPTAFIPNPIIQQAPQEGPGGTESQTLFNGPHEDHDLPFNGQNHDSGRRMSFWNPMSMSMSLGMGANMPNAGGVGRLSLSKGSEGLGLGLGLEHTHEHVN